MISRFLFVALLGALSISAQLTFPIPSTIEVSYIEVRFREIFELFERYFESYSKDVLKSCLFSSFSPHKQGNWTFPSVNYTIGISVGPNFEVLTVTGLDDPYYVNVCSCDYFH